MTSSSTKTDLRRVRELGKYSEESASRNETGRPHEKSRVWAAEDVDYIGCWECGKFMDKVKSRFMCSCKEVVYCSKACFKSSNHKCEEPWLDVPDIPEKNIDPDPEKNVWACYQCDLNDEEAGEAEAQLACTDQYEDDMMANRGPSSDKMTHFMRIMRGDHRRILKYAEAKNPTAALVIARAYKNREFDRQAVFAIPLKYKDESPNETNKMAIKWLKVATEGGLPDAMFLLFVCLENDPIGLNWREGQYWLAEAHATGKMDYLTQILETPSKLNFPAEINFMINQIRNASIKQPYKIGGETLANLLVATRFREIKAWAGKTAMGKPFYGWGQFKKLMELIGEVKIDESKPSFIVGEKKTLTIILASPGFLDLVAKISTFRDENNSKLKHGVKDEASPDYQLAAQTNTVYGRTSYYVSCDHSPIDNMEEEETMERINSLEDIMKRYKHAGTCESCVEVAKQRLRAVSLGLYSISITPVCRDWFYVARYAKEDGIVVQDVFRGYSKPYIKQTLQCLMTNPQDLHPLAVAENTILFWPIIWFWGSVHAAVRDCCDQTTLDAIYDNLGPNLAVVENDDGSARVAFPEDAAGEWRIACGNEECPRVDHEVKFNLCAGCKVRRYCGPGCQAQDWTKHKHACAE